MKEDYHLPIKLANPAQRALAGAGIRSLEDLAKYSEEEIAALHGIGKHALVAIRQALVERGLGFSENSQSTN